MSITSSIKSFNLIIEKNGSGKTNLLEAIFYTIYQTSFRSFTGVSELINKNEDPVFVSLEWDSNIIKLSIQKQSNRFAKKLTLNEKRVFTKKIIEKFPVIIFAPNSIDLVNGEPENRRRDLDFFLSSYIPGYYDLIVRYKKVLKNRNSVIKAIREEKAGLNQLDFWTKEIIKLNVSIMQYRKKYFVDIKNIIKSVYPDIFHGVEDFKIKYLPNLDFKENLEEEISNKYLQNSDKEIIVGKTLYGIHKDDFQFIFDNKDLKFKGSRGQQRLGSFIVKVSQYKLIKDKENSQTLFLIDDLMSELDVVHRQNLADYLINKLTARLILTGADINEIPKNLIDISNRINI